MKAATKKKINDAWDMLVDDDMSTERALQIVSDETGFDVDVIVRAVFTLQKDKP